MVQATGLAAVISQAAAAAEPYRQQAEPYVQPVVDAVMPAVHQAHSVVTQLSGAAYDASISAAWAMRNFTSSTASS